MKAEKDSAKLNEVKKTIHEPVEVDVHTLKHYPLQQHGEEQNMAFPKSENFYQQLIQTLPVAIYTCDKDGYITTFNAAATRLWGRTPEIGKDMWCGSWKIYQTDGSMLPLDLCPMAIALKEARPVYGEEIIIVRPDGKTLNVLPYPKPLFDDNGALTGAVNMLVDISLMKQATKDLQESEDRFRTLADQAPVIIWMTDDKGDFNYVNTKWTEFTGRKIKSEPAAKWIEDVHPDDRSYVEREWADAHTNRKTVDIKYRLRGIENKYIFIRATGSPRYNAAGSFVGFIGILMDITAQEKTRSSLKKQVEEQTAFLVKKNEELRRSEERYHRMISEVQDYVIILLDAKGIIQNWNKGAEKIKGYKANEVIGKSFKMFYPEEDRLRGVPDQLLERARQEGKANHEGWRVRSDGSKFWGSVVMTALHNDNDEVIGFTKVTRDLTERKKIEEALKHNAAQLREQNKMLESMNQELASFAYVSSHDLQEPLRKIQTFASRIVETEQSLSPEGKDYFIRMQNAALRMQTLIEDLLAYSRTNTTEKNFEPTDLNLLLEEVKTELREFIDEKKAIIKISALPTLNVISFQFRQLLTNILSNALKFSKTDIRPEISIHYDKVAGNKIRNNNGNLNKMYHHIEISDNGIGFEPEYCTKIFEVFQRLHGRSEYTGTGIGLAICKKIVENHGGIIQAESTPGEGATFHIYIPDSVSF